MDVAENHLSSGYARGPPWFFKGSALYQLHLVKAETARAFIPKEFKIVEAFGYTLGGFFLAHYDDSPAARFDELVVIAGIIWNPPTSCAWAARVLVNSNEACRHGRKEVGLPSHVGIFSKRVVDEKEKTRNRFNRFLDMIGISSDFKGPKKCTEVQVSECKDSSVLPLCSITLPYVVHKSETNKNWMGPAIRMSLPSFSGQTVYNPNLLKYSCQIECRVRAVKTAEVSGPMTDLEDAKSRNKDKPGPDERNQSSKEENAWNQSISVLLSKPILALEFSLLKMQVEAPTIMTLNPRKRKE